MVKVYYCNISKLENSIELIKSLPDLRRQYVNSIKDRARQKQSVFVWKLLEYAVKLNYSDEIVDFIYNGESFCEKNNSFYFSLSHSSNYVAVAVSNQNVGVDIEKCSNKILKLYNKKLFSEDSVDALTIEWTKNESLFKAKKGKNFFWNKIYDGAGDEYILTVCTDESNAEFINVNLLI